MTCNFCIRNNIEIIVRIKNYNLPHRVSIRKTFAQFLRNETQIFLSLHISFARKKQQFAQSFAKVISHKIALFRFCETQVLRNSATKVFAQFRNFTKIKRLVTVCVSYNSILEQSCFGIHTSESSVHFPTNVLTGTILH